MTLDRINTDVQILTGDVLAMLKKLPAESVHCVITSPPYWGLRDYGVDGQLGLEPTPAQYLRNMVRVFRAVRRVLRKDGTLWVNMGDSYAGNRGGIDFTAKSTLVGKQPGAAEGVARTPKRGNGLKPKDLVGMPWRLALALQADGWWLRRDIIWAKRNTMPEPVTDRCTSAHEYFFHLSRSSSYHYDAAAIAEPCIDPADDARRIAQQHNGNKSAPTELQNGLRTRSSGNKERVYGVNASHPHIGRNVPWEGTTRNRRSWWPIATKPYTEAHFAVMPPELVEGALLAGCPVGGTVLDPFGGSGTTAGVALAHGRKAVLIELNPAYVALMPRRIEQVMRSLLDAPAPPPVAHNQPALFP